MPGLKKPDEIAKPGTEHAIQSALFCICNFAAKHGPKAALAWAEGLVWAHLSIAPPDCQPDHISVPEFKWIHAIHNQGHGDAVRGAKAKAEGTKAGIPDLFCPFPRGQYAGLYIEMKKPGGRASLEQVEFATYAIHNCYCWQMFDNWRDAFQFIWDYYEGEIK